jgi:hypothetical protein
MRQESLRYRQEPKPRKHQLDLLHQVWIELESDTLIDDVSKFVRKTRNTTILPSFKVCYAHSTMKLSIEISDRLTHFDRSSFSVS